MFRGLVFRVMLVRALLSFWTLRVFWVWGFVNSERLMVLGAGFRTLKLGCCFLNIVLPLLLFAGEKAREMERERERGGNLTMVDGCWSFNGTRVEV